MKKTNKVYAMISTFDGKHLVIHQKENNAYTFPGGEVADRETAQQSITRLVFETTGIKFDINDFKLDIEFEQDNVINYGFICNKIISDMTPTQIFDKNIVPLFLEPRVFYTLTTHKNIYNGLYK